MNNDYEVGQHVKATVVSKIEYGMRVELASGGVALLHRKDIDWISDDPMSLLSVGDVIDVRIISIDPERKRIKVSRRALLPNPQDAFVLNVQVGAVYLGTVRKILDYGAFIEIAPGVRGLLHSSEMGGQTCSPGDSIRVRVVDIDYDSKHITLSREAEAHPRPR